jgi:hypothetical protein
LRPVRNSGEGSTYVGSSTYSHTRTKDLITHHPKVHLPVDVIKPSSLGFKDTDWLQ